MKFLIPPDKEKLFDRLPRKDRKPLAEVAAVETFKLIGWATAIAGIYLLQQRSGSIGLKIIPYLLWVLIVWDLSDKFNWEPPIERKDGHAYVVLTPGYFYRLAAIGVFCWFIAWAVIFWLAPLVHIHVLAGKLGCIA